MPKAMSFGDLVWILRVGDSVRSSTRQRETVYLLWPPTKTQAFRCSKLRNTASFFFSWVAGIMIGEQHLARDQMGTPNHKPPTRVRWTPSQIQFQILERLFEQDNGTPNKQHLKEIADELRQHGQIAETNVYNWFQNRKARAKRRHQQVARRCRTHLNQAKGAQQVTQLILPELPSCNQVLDLG